MINFPTVVRCSSLCCFLKVKGHWRKPDIDYRCRVFPAGQVVGVGCQSIPFHSSGDNQCLFYHSNTTYHLDQYKYGHYYSSNLITFYSGNDVSSKFLHLNYLCNDVVLSLLSIHSIPLYFSTTSPVLRRLNY